MIVCFPIFLLLARWWAETRHRWFAVIVSLGCPALLVIETALFVRGYSVG